MFTRNSRNNSQSNQRLSHAILDLERVFSIFLFLTKSSKSKLLEKEAIAKIELGIYKK